MEFWKGGRKGGRERRVLERRTKRGHDEEVEDEKQERKGRGGEGGENGGIL